MTVSPGIRVFNSQSPLSQKILGKRVLTLLVWLGELKVKPLEVLENRLLQHQNSTLAADVLHLLDALTHLVKAWCC